MNYEKINSPAHLAQLLEDGNRYKTQNSTVLSCFPLNKYYFVVEFPNGEYKQVDSEWYDFDKLTLIKPKQWYEEDGAFPCFCYCHDDDMRQRIVCVNEYNEREVFNFISDINVGWKYATPLTKKEAKKLIYKAEK